MKPIIGIDFDNTIICYDNVFHTLALKYNLISPDFPKNKEKIRNFLRNINKEQEWTALQGEVYGKKMLEAQPFPGIKNFFKTVCEHEYKLSIVSHKTLYPYIGPKYNLHEAAYQWLEQNQFFSLIKREQVYLEPTKSEKCNRILANQCTHFIDDLPEFLLDQDFPKTVHKLWFAPQENETRKEYSSLIKYSSWNAISNYFFQADH